MTQFTYTPDRDGWVFLMRGAMCIGVAVSDEDPLVHELWTLLETPANAGVALDVLTRAGISSAASFVIVTIGTDATVLVRGSAQVTVEGSTHDTVTGVGYSSWAERSFAQIDRFECEISAAGSSTVSARFPLLEGVVRASRLGTITPAASLLDHANSDELVVTSIVGSQNTKVVEPAASLAETALNVAEPMKKGVEAPIPVAEETVVVSDDDDYDDDAESDVPQMASPVSPYDHLFGETAYRTVEDAAVRPVEEDDDDPPQPGLEEHTVVASDLSALRAQRRASRGRNPLIAMPVAAFLVELSTGGQEFLDQTLVIGRAPAAAALGGGGDIPRLVTMTTPNQDISRTHARIAIEGGTVVVTDLHSRNGTIVTLPGRAAQKLREGESTVVIPGTVVDLGDGATLTVREV